MKRRKGLGTWGEAWPGHPVRLKYDLLRNGITRQKERADGFGLLFLESAAWFKLQRPRILRHRPHHVIRRAVGNFSGNFQAHRHVRADQADEVRNDLLGDLASIAPDAVGVEGDGTMETLGPGG